MIRGHCVFCLNFLLALSSICSQEHILCGVTFTEEENAVKTQTPSWDPELSTLALSPTLPCSLNRNGLPQAHAFECLAPNWWHCFGLKTEPCPRKWVRWE